MAEIENKSIGNNTDFSTAPYNYDVAGHFNSMPRGSVLGAYYLFLGTFYQFSGWKVQPRSQSRFSAG